MWIVELLIIAYFLCGAFTVRFMFEDEKPKFTDKLATFWGWPVLAFTIFCIAAALYLTGITWYDTKKNNHKED